MKHSYVTGNVDIYLTPGMNGHINVSLNDMVYRCIYERGLLQGTQTMSKGDVDQIFNYYNGKMHGEVIEIFNSDYINTKHYINGLLEGKH